MTKAIIFDFWGVLCNDLYWSWLQKNVKDMDKPEVTERFTQLSLRTDMGEISSEEFFNELAKMAGTKPEKILADWMINMTVNRELTDYIAELKTKYKIGLVSNTNDIIDRAIARFDLDKLFDDMVISYRVKLAKPKPEIFQLAMEHLGVKPSETVYVDDHYYNLETANTLGMKGVLFLSTADFKEKMKKLGI